MVRRAKTTRFQDKGSAMEISKIGIVGAGQMGNGIAHVCALAGYEIWLNDVSQDQLDKGVALIDRNLAK